jgi:hypothetical protein
MMPSAPEKGAPPVLRPLSLLLLAACLAASAPAGGQEARHALGHPGYIVMAGAVEDTTGTFVWQSGPGATQRSLVWEDGVLTIPADLVPETFGPADLAIPCGPELAGGGHGGKLVFSGGNYRIHEPLLLTDGTVTLYATAGTLEILGERVRYVAPRRSLKDPRASYILLAGLVLLTLVLLRRARIGFREGGSR